MNGAKFRVLLLAISCNVATWLTLAAANAFAQSGTASAERGAKLYLEKMCYTCHGYAGQGGERGSGPTLTPGLWPYPAFAQQVRHPRQDMPRYGSRFVSEDELADIYAYLASIKPGPDAKDIVPLRDKGGAATHARRGYCLHLVSAAGTRHRRGPVRLV